MKEIETNGIKIYPLPDCDSDEDEEYQEQVIMLFIFIIYHVLTNMYFNLF